MRKEKDVLLSAIKEAGQVILQLQKQNLTVWQKTNNEILTQADLSANEILKSHLLTAFPNYGWLSEETIDEATRLTKTHTWIIDPIDGTKEFAAKLPEFAISVALAENNRIVLAAVFNPATNELCHAEINGGAWEGKNKLSCQKLLAQEKPILLASRTEFEKNLWQSFAKDTIIKPIGSIAYKLSLIAKGIGHATFSLGPKHEWDIAAGSLLVQEAGGKVCNSSHKEIFYNQKNIKVPGIIAAEEESFNDIMKICQLSEVF